VRALDDVEVGQHLAGADEEAAARERDLALRVVGDDGDDRGLDAAYQLGERLGLRARRRRGGEEEKGQERQPWGKLAFQHRGAFFSKGVAEPEAV
jgi:hypothetical protein